APAPHRGPLAPTWPGTVRRRCLGFLARPERCTLSFTLSSNGWGRRVSTSPPRDAASEEAMSSVVVSQARSAGPPGSLRSHEAAAHHGRPRGEVVLDDQQVGVIARRDPALAAA